jgi:hypothetical protein
MLPESIADSQDGPYILCKYCLLPMLAYRRGSIGFFATKLVLRCIYIAIGKVKGLHWATRILAHIDRHEQSRVAARSQHRRYQGPDPA